MVLFTKSISDEQDHLESYHADDIHMQKLVFDLLVFSEEMGSLGDLPPQPSGTLRTRVHHAQ